MKYQFRAYHKPTGAIIPWDVLQALMRGKEARVSRLTQPVNAGRFSMDVEQARIQGPLDPFSHPDLVVMMATGMQDQEGVEIFGGDIIHSQAHNPARYVVDFEDGGFCATHPHLVGYPIDLNHFINGSTCRVKVVGNFHQHPERLNV